MQPDNATPEGEEEETEAGEGEDTGGGSGNNSNETDGGTGGGGSGGEGEGNAGKETGRKGGSHPKPALPVRYRTFAKNIESGVYSLLVSLDEQGSQSVNLLVSTVGDDQKAPADIRTARMEDGTAIPVAGPGVIGPILLSAGSLHRIEVTLSEPVRVAMEVSAHEA
jgi:hypothetical protein